MKREDIQNILVPIDFSQMSIQAIETAKRLAQRFGATIHLAHIHQFGYPATFRGPIFSAGELPESFEQHRTRQLTEELQAIARKAGLSSRDKTHLRTGAAPFDEICRLAQEIPADLIVMPTHGYTGIKHVLLGSTAERVVRHSPSPVFVVRQEKRKKSETGRPFTADTILVPVDFSSCSLEGLNYAIQFADRVAASLILLHSVHLAAYIGGGYAYDLSRLEEDARKDAQRQMQEFVRLAKFGSVKFETAIRIGAPMPEICSFAEEQDVDLIITATHGLTGFKHVLIGSIAEQIVRHAPCSVLVVPSHPKNRIENLAKSGGRKTQAVTSSPRRIRPGADQRQSRKSTGEKALTKKDRKLAAHAFPERRKTNRFREGHSNR